MSAKEVMKCVDDCVNELFRNGSGENAMLKAQLADAEKRGLEKARRVSLLHECHASHICRCWFEIEKLINAEIAKLEAK